MFCLPAHAVEWFTNWKDKTEITESVELITYALYFNWKMITKRTVALRTSFTESNKTKMANDNILHEMTIVYFLDKRNRNK